MTDQPLPKGHPRKKQVPPRASLPPAGGFEKVRSRSLSVRRGIVALLAIIVLTSIVVASWQFFRAYSVSVVIQPRSIEPTLIAAVQIASETSIPSPPTAAPAPAHTETDAPSPTPTPEPEHTPTALPPIATADPVAAKFAEVQRLLGDGRAQRDGGALNKARVMLDELGTDDAGMTPELSLLRRQTEYALDVLAGTIYLNDANTSRLAMLTEQGLPLVNPVDMTFSHDSLYVIDSGTLYRGDLSQLLIADGNPLMLTAIITPTAQIDGFPVKELVAVETSNIENGIYVLDKSNDIYFFDYESGQWGLQRSQATEFNRPDPHFLSTSSYSNTLYLLDPSRNQIWRHPPSDAGAAYLPSNLPWAISPGEPDVTAAVDLAIDGFIYTLRRDGTIVKYSPAEYARFSLAVANGRSHLTELAVQPVLPKSIFANAENGPLYIADAGRRSVVAIDREDGAFLRQFVAPDNPDFSYLHAVAERADQLFVLAGANLYAIRVGEEVTQPVALDGELPQYWHSPNAENARLSDLSPNDPRVPQLLASHALTMPLAGALLPDRFVMYPGARRAYRYGVHRGLDLYEADVGIEVKTGTPVLAVAVGIIKRADVDYQEMSAEEVHVLLVEADKLHITPEETLDKLGGRQIWIEHDGFLTKYEHLSGVAEGIAVGQTVDQGQLIGYVGSSGTPDKIYGNPHIPHLHFEIRIGPDYQYYLGQWLTVEDARRALEQIFAVPVYSATDNPPTPSPDQVEQTPDETEEQEP